MTCMTSDRFAVVDSSFGGLQFRSAPSLKGLITELLLNSGSEIALWAEGEAARCAKIWREGKAKEKWFSEYTRVDAENYPDIFRAFREIDLANGAINRLESARESYAVPNHFHHLLQSSEIALHTLSDEQLESFCDGGYDENQGLLKTRPDLLDASELLNLYFNGWSRD